MTKNNWFLQLRNLAKTDTTAAELYDSLQKAETDEEKEIAKEKARLYIEQLQQSESGESDNTETTTTEETPDEEGKNDDVEPDSVSTDESVVSDSESSLQENTETDEEEDEEDDIMDLSCLAFNPRLANCGITREEELFLKGVCVRKMTRDEKILMRRSIYQKKTQRNNRIQAELKAKRLAQKQQDLNDPQKQKFHQERRYIAAVAKALENHKNMIWIFSNIEGLTPEILGKLLEKPENQNAIRQVKPRFLTDFRKKYGF